ncbi:MAG: hypothetical protein N3D16_09780 [Anaerolineales bacterium]|nr:hypothetical protein [Anaerolineales bacterium]
MLDLLHFSLPFRRIVARPETLHARLPAADGCWTHPMILIGVQTVKVTNR